MKQPAHLLRIPNLPIRDLSNEQLEEERAYYKHKLDSAPTWGAAVGAWSSRLKQLDKEYGRRLTAAPPVLSPSPVAWLHILHVSATIYTRQVLFFSEPPWQRPLPEGAWMEVQPLYVMPALQQGAAP